MNSEIQVQEVKLNGNLSVANSASILAEIKAAFNTRQEVHLCFGDVESIDLTFIQLLLSARFTASDLGLPFLLTGEIPESLVELAHEAAMEQSLTPLYMNEESKMRV